MIAIPFSFFERAVVVSIVLADVFSDEAGPYKIYILGIHDLLNFTESL
jgi:hypothetical protein